MDKEKLIEIAKAFHDGPLMAGDFEFDPEDKAGKWCVEIVEFIEAQLLSHNSDSSEPVAVKPLEWRLEPIPPMGEWLASSPVGLYCIPIGSGKLPLRFRDEKTLATFASLEEAKAAAQADYEARIHSALASPPAKEVTDEMVDRMADHIQSQDRGLTERHGDWIDNGENDGFDMRAALSAVLMGEA